MDLIGLGFVGVFAALMVVFTFINKRRTTPHLRDIPSFYRLSGAIELSVEDGTRLHISVGGSPIIGARSTAALAGLRVVEQITRIASEGDCPPVATAGDATLAILAQDTLRATYHSLGREASYDPGLGRAVGLTPFSYAAGMLPVILDEDVSANVLAGSFGLEAILPAAAAEHHRIFTLAGADSIPGQAVMYAIADEPLLGEELYASGAYLGAGGMHIASLHVQDIFRYLLVLALIGGSIANLLGSLP